MNLQERFKTEQFSVLTHSLRVWIQMYWRRLPKITWWPAAAQMATSTHCQSTWVQALRVMTLLECYHCSQARRKSLRQRSHSLVWLTPQCWWSFWLKWWWDRRGAVMKLLEKAQNIGFTAEAFHSNFSLCLACTNFWIVFCVWSEELCFWTIYSWLESSLESETGFSCMHLLHSHITDSIHYLGPNFKTIRMMNHKNCQYINFRSSVCEPQHGVLESFYVCTPRGKQVNKGISSLPNGNLLFW